jgi:hypothetical protein
MSLDPSPADAHASRFYFHLNVKGRLLRDRRGEELAGPAAAHARGFDIARALLGRRGEGALDPAACVLQVADAHSRTLCTIAFSAKRPARAAEMATGPTPHRAPGRLRKRARRRAAAKPGCARRAG